MKICPKCSTVNNDTARFCEECGAALAAAADAAAAGAVFMSETPEAAGTAGSAGITETPEAAGTTEIPKPPVDAEAPKTPEDAAPAEPERPVWESEEPDWKTKKTAASPEGEKKASEWETESPDWKKEKEDTVSPDYGASFDPLAIPSEYRPLSFGAYLGYGLLFLIPCAGTVCQILAALGVFSNNTNLKNFARATLCIGVIVCFLTIIGLTGTLANIFDLF